ncbi:MAG: MBL fold metallo-hydrolase [Gemmatimonadota bacterium]
MARPIQQLLRHGPRAGTLALALGLAACNPAAIDHGPGETPTIVIQGIAEGYSYDGPVAIGISIDRGVYSATLDGAPYTAGDTVRVPGAHVLVVNASQSLATVTREIHFTIRPLGGGVLIVRMINLGSNDAGGGGDSILITDSSAAGMVHALIDAGPSGPGGNDPAFVAHQLAALHVDTLAALLLTHAHDDHYGGIGPVLSGVKVQRFLYNGQVRSLSSYNAVVSQARTFADSVIVVSALREYDLGHAATPAHLKFLTPLATHLAATTDDGDDLNNGSVGARLDLGTFSMLFTGDGEAAANANWSSQFNALVRNVTVLKVGHHGANNAIFDNGFSGAAAWLDLAAPRISILSANGTTHPRIAALNRLLAQPNSQTYCTNVHGTITIRVDRTGSYVLTVERNAAMTCVPGTQATS